MPPLVGNSAQRCSTLLGKVAIVTGGASGIGFACAQCLGQEGCAVLVADIDQHALERAVQQLKSADLTVQSCICDVSDQAQVRAMVEAACTAFGRGLDILVANAGIVRTAPFLDMALSDFEAVLDVNLKGVFLCGQEAAKRLVQQNQAEPGRGGAIVNISSVHAVMASGDLAGYCASKGAINSLTQCEAIALAQHNIRCNAILPGSVSTPVMDAVVRDQAAMSRVLSRTPLGRVADPVEIGSICAFLASPAASYMTGELIPASGGRLALNYTM